MNYVIGTKENENFLDVSFFVLDGQGRKNPPGAPKGQ